MAELARSGSAWVSAHAFFQDDLDLLVTQVVAPLVEELADGGMAGEYFFLRYWEGGPHLRFRVLPAAGVSRDEVQRLIGERFGQYLSQRPSPDRWSAEDYAALAPRLARQEGMRSWAPRLSPNNSVAFIAYRREHDRYGDDASIQAVERHFAESSRIALRVVALAAPAPQRATLALACLLVAWFLGGTDRDDLTIWLGDRLGAAPPEPAPADELSRTVELARTAQQLAEGNFGPRPESALACWARSMGELRTALATAAGGSDQGVLPVLDLCAHLICNRLGVSVTTETALRKLAAGAVDSLRTERN